MLLLTYGVDTTFLLAYVSSYLLVCRGICTPSAGASASIFKPLMDVICMEYRT